MTCVAHRIHERVWSPCCLLLLHEHFYTTPAQKVKAIPLPATLKLKATPASAQKPLSRNGTSWGHPSISSTRACDAGSVGPEVVKNLCKTVWSSCCLLLLHEDFYATPAQKVKAILMAVVLKLRAKPASAEKALSRNGTTWGGPWTSSTRTCDTGNVGTWHTCARQEKIAGYSINRGGTPTSARCQRMQKPS